MENEVLRVLVLAILVAAAISNLPDRQRESIVRGFETAGQIIFGVIRMIMWAAPLGAFGGMAFTVAEFGGASLKNLGLLMVTFWGTCAFFIFVILGAVARWSGFSHPQAHTAHQGRVADHPRHVVLGDRAATAAGQARGGRRVARRWSGW